MAILACEEARTRHLTSSREITARDQKEAGFGLIVRLPRCPVSGLSARRLWKRAGLLLPAISFFICRCVTRIGASATSLRKICAPGTSSLSKATLGRFPSGRCAVRDGGGWRRVGSTLTVARFGLCGSTLPAYMRGYLPGGERVLVRGRVAAAADGGIEIVQPELHRLSEGEPKAIRPVYRLPSIVGQRLFANLVHARSRRAGRFDPRSDP